MGKGIVDFNLYKHIVLYAVQYSTCKRQVEGGKAKQIQKWYSLSREKWYFSFSENLLHDQRWNSLSLMGGL
jgi:hypothetical protein